MLNLRQVYISLNFLTSLGYIWETLVCGRQRRPGKRLSADWFTSGDKYQDILILTINTENLSISTSHAIYIIINKNFVLFKYKVNAAVVQ